MRTHIEIINVTCGHVLTQVDTHGHVSLNMSGHVTLNTGRHFSLQTM